MADSKHEEKSEHHQSYERNKLNQQIEAHVLNPCVKIKWKDLVPWSMIRGVNKQGVRVLVDLIRRNGYQSKDMVVCRKAKVKDKCSKDQIVDGQHRYEALGWLILSDDDPEFTPDFEVGPCPFCLEFNIYIYMYMYISPPPPSPPGVVFSTEAGDLR
jgi:hypothetical protein